MKAGFNTRFLLLGLALAAALVVVGCSEDTPLAPAGDTIGVTTDEKGNEVIHQDGSYVPADQVTIDCFGKDLAFWPFTSSMLDGSPMDPVNLVFAGHADPMQIRAALLGLDGDRSLLGLPDAYPFNQVWTDALGGTVQSTWAEDGGWLGSVIQLTLGNYDPIRFHLRLFRTRAFGEGGTTCTLGAAHFEVLIPGTTDHQVLSWEVARDLVVGDLMRSGLLDPSMHLRPTQPITPTPTWREIIPAIYNELPADLVYLIGGPPQPVDAPVGIGNGDGTAMMVYLAAPAPVEAGICTSGTTIEFGQYVPRPYCSEGPGDWLYITGPVHFDRSVVVDEYGVFSYEEGYEGLLNVQPLDMATGMPAGDPFEAPVWGRQNGWMSATGGRVQARDVKTTDDDEGPQRQDLSIKIGEWNKARYTSKERCFDAQ